LVEAVQIPSVIRAGDSVTWRVDASTDNLGNSIDSSTWTLTYYLRTSTASQGTSIAGTPYGAGWEFTLTSAVSTTLEAGNWFWQAVAASGDDVATLSSGQLQVLPSLAFTGDPTAFDGRSQAEQDLESVQTAIRSLITKGSKQYSIGSRSYTAQDLGLLMQRESQLKAIVARERAKDKIAQGLGDPMNVFVRFG
jgi:hypothetical protein